MGQGQHRMLGGGVGRARHFRDMAAGPGGDVDYAAVPPLAHRREHRAHAIEHAVEIDLDKLVPAVELHVVPAPFCDIDAGTVDQKLDASVPRHDLAGHLLDVSGGADIERYRLGLSAGTSD